MKIIDEKGRLFGKLNLIDLLVIVLIAAIAVVAVVKYTGRDTELKHYSASLNRPMEYSVVCRMVYRDAAENAKQEVGKQLMAGGELVEGCFITAVEERPYYESYVDASGTLQHAESPDFCDLIITVKGEAPYVDEAYQVGTQEVRIGKAHILKTVNLELNAIVISLEGAE